MLEIMTEAKLRQLEYRYGLQRVEIHDPGMSAEVWAFRHRDASGAQLVTVCTVDQPQDFSITGFEADLGALVALLRTVLNRADGIWLPGRVWLNDQALLLDTKIQGLVVGEGDWAEVFPLTELEANVVARETLSAITIVKSRAPDTLYDLFRENAFPDVTDDQLAEVKVFTSKQADSAPLRRIKALSYHRFAAFTNEEPEGYLEDPDNFEVKTALELLPRLHGSRLFFQGEAPGEQLSFGHKGWEYSVT